jgi:outer membrane protein assembly factor BamB
MMKGQRRERWLMRRRGALVFLLLAAMLGACSSPAHRAATSTHAPHGNATAAQTAGTADVGTTTAAATRSTAGTQTAAAAIRAQATTTPEPAANGTADWPVYDHDPQRSGVSNEETATTPSTVARLQRRWTQALPDVVGGSPILLSNMQLADGSHADLLYVTTSHGSTLALNAASGAIVWRQDTSGPQIANQRCQICATPAADPSRAWVYATGNDGAIHRYAATTGNEDTTAPWPVAVTLLNGYEKRSSALNLANGYLYVALSGYFGDFGPYVGHVVAIHLPDGAARVFNALCSDKQQLLAPTSVVANSQAACAQREAGIWARAGVVVDQGGGPTDGSLYISTGNGPFDANQGGRDYGDSVLRLSGDASRLLDSYTPASYQQLDDRDLDLSSTAPALLPPQTRSTTPYLAVQGGKDQILRLLNRAQLGGVGGELQTINLNQGLIFSTPAIWHDAAGSDPHGDNDWLFVTAARATVAYRIVTDGNGATRLQEAWRLPQGGSSPIVVGGVLYLTDGSGVSAHDPRTGKQLWSSAQPSAGGNVGGNHWQTPIVVNGRLYLADENGQLSCYALPGA